MLTHSGMTLGPLLSVTAIFNAMLFKEHKPAWVAAN